MNPWRVIVEDHSQTCGVETLDQLNCSPASCNQIARNELSSSSRTGDWKKRGNKKTSCLL